MKLVKTYLRGKRTVFSIVEGSDRLADFATLEDAAFCFRYLTGGDMTPEERLGALELFRQCDERTRDARKAKDGI